MLGTAEIVARIFWEQEKTDICQVDDPRVGMLFKANCTAHIKAAEGPWVVNQYNECGYRTKEPCHIKAADQLRVAVIGMSIGRGYEVSYEASFAARASQELTASCSRPVDFQNLGGGSNGSPIPLRNIFLRAHEALSIKPDAILMVVTPFDIQQLYNAPPSNDLGDKSQSHRSLHVVLKEKIASLSKTARSSRAFFVAQHLLYLNLAAYLPVYLKHEDEADYLRLPFKPAWQERFSLLDQSLSKVKSVAQDAGVPVLLVFVPQRAQAALLTWRDRPTNIDPLAMGQKIGFLAAKYGIRYIDMTRLLSVEADLDDNFYAVDAHPSAQGHAVIAQAVVSSLIGSVPAFSKCAANKQAAEGSLPN